jgi:hypothetical protein
MENENLIYISGKQLIKVRFIMTLALVCAVWAVIAGVGLAQNYGLSPGDGGVLRPLAERLAWGVGVAVLGLAFAVGMDLYGRQYAARIYYQEKERKLRIETLRWWGFASECRPVLDLTGRKHNHGQLNTGEHSVDAPWCFLYFRNRSFPIILDLQGQFSDPTLAGQLLGVNV